MSEDGMFVNIITAAQTIAKCDKGIDLVKFEKSLDPNEVAMVEKVLRKWALKVDKAKKENKKTSVVKSNNKSKAFFDGQDAGIKFANFLNEQKAIASDSMLKAAEEFLKGDQNLDVLDTTHSYSDMTTSLKKMCSARTIYSFSFKVLETRMIEQAKMMHKKGLKDKLPIGLEKSSFFL